MAANPKPPVSPKVGLAAGAVAGAIALAMPVVMYFEGKVNRVYVDPVQILTACYGHTDPALRPGETFTDEQCLEKLNADLVEASRGVEQCIRAPLTMNQRAALISFTFNVGQGQLCKSTLARKANAGQPFCHELSRWTYAGGRQLPGLVRRRAAERALCES